MDGDLAKDALPVATRLPELGVGIEQCRPEAEVLVW